MEKLYESKFVEILYDKNIKLMKAVWFEVSKIMKISDMSEIIETIANLIKQKKPTAYYTDSRNRFFSYPKDSQEWISTTLTETCITAGVKKIAILNSKDLRVELSTHQVVEYAKDYDQIKKVHFTNDEDAMEWLCG